MKRPHYGIDAPPVIKQLFLSGIVALVIGFLIYYFTLTHYPRIAITLLLIAVIFSASYFIPVIYMLLSSLFGKKHMRDFLINSLYVKGNEKVLDVGCGRGLLLIAAAKKLTQGGKAVGIDLWNCEDLSNNQAIFTKQNAELEGVSDRIEIVSGDMTNMNFNDNTFDYIVSSMSIHNIPTPEKRRKAITEIARVLKPGGEVALLDFQCLKEYKNSLIDLGFQNVKISRLYFWMFPPVRIATGKK
ncbi:MAG: methyltransferase type 11 [uncultured bacterium]|nr:MAG: methyltransferase type 11 [uncultured bacterium]OGT25947.1 MAG: hypothetical protein A3B71_07860 [Gammaproteobacteria bacterium RIFCSPHIGHO2_02_FULL_42_43]OGT52332.1 MAG: hypothetical protein A3E54_01740 [Gammaproteobacteria bacterium RIFCSPHIGHO2_12_FULL_41_25]OGT61943.1 MAG: hypothetical protein A3I77_01675 [Gammaproteobacteria bacterium RIFCSPLOWO2_02_FULL_42_14]OGT86345.1 MAG: hypothetical protein A3G86_07415 [Gammaproteobacteria bacterium RIFCSPLOWO2_12_FULL_42_18]